MPTDKKKGRAENHPIEPPAVSLEKLKPVSLDAVDDDLFVEQALLEQAGSSGCRASRVAFDTCILRRASLDGSRLTRLKLLDVAIEKSNLINAEWPSATIHRVELSGCRMMGFAVNGGDLRDLRVRDCKADFMKLAASKIRDASFEECGMAEAEFQDAVLEGVTFRNCNLHNADFTGARLNRVDLTGSTIDGLRIEPNQLKGLTIDASQVMFVVALLGITVK